MRPTRRYIVTMGLLLAAAPAMGALTAEQKCQAGKNQAAGKYADCRQKAEASLVKTGDPTKYAAAISKCETKFQTKWQKLIDAATAAGATCPDAPLTRPDFQSVIDEHTDNLAQALGGGGLGDCSSDLATCTSDLATCTSELATCYGANYLPAQRLKTGQTQCYNASGSVIACAGTGQDGELQKGVARTYVDNGNGTVTDTKTGLTWEKLDDNNTGGIHDADNTYTWTTAVTTKIAALNTPPCFADQCDWRLPNRNELESLADLGRVNPAIDPAFNTACTASCTVTTCSCTRTGDGFWSSTTYQLYPGFAWFVFFYDGPVSALNKTGNGYVRAVRGGS